MYLKEQAEELIRCALRIESSLRAVLYRYLGNAADVDELLQETYARLLGGSLNAARNDRAYCFAVARNTALDWLRHRGIVSIELVGDLESLEVSDEGADVESLTNADQELEWLARMCQSLPPQCRKVFTLRKVYGYTQKEIAERLGISENTVEQHLGKAARRCADVLSKDRTIEGGVVRSALKRVKQKV